MEVLGTARRWMLLLAVFLGIGTMHALAVGPATAATFTPSMAAPHAPSTEHSLVLDSPLSALPPTSGMGTATAASPASMGAMATDDHAPGPMPQGTPPARPSSACCGTDRPAGADPPDRAAVRSPVRAPDEDPFPMMNHKPVFGVLAAGVAALLLAGCGGTSTPATDAPATATPATVVSSGPATVSAAHNAADITFAQQMIPHHQQAVAMAQLAADRAANGEVKQLAARIQGAQDPEITRMQAFLPHGAPRPRHPSAT